MSINITPLQDKFKLSRVGNVVCISNEDKEKDPL